MALVDVDVKKLVDEAAITLVPAIEAALSPIIDRAVQTLAGEISKLGPALVDDLTTALAGLTITVTIDRRKPA